MKLNKLYLGIKNVSNDKFPKFDKNTYKSTEEPDIDETLEDESAMDSHNDEFIKDVLWSSAGPTAPFKARHQRFMGGNL